MSFSFAINRKHCRFCNVFFHTRCARARARVCVRWWLEMGVDKCIQNQADGERGGVKGGGELANVATIVDKLFKKLSRF